VYYGWAREAGCGADPGGSIPMKNEHIADEGRYVEPAARLE
jgi:hypothetical protein